MDFKDMTANFLDDDQYFNLVSTNIKLSNLIKDVKFRQNKQEKIWAIQFPITDNLEKLDVVTKAAKRKLAILPSNTGKDRVSKSALASYINKLEKYKEDVLKAIEEEELSEKEEAEKKVKEAE
jgi:hypothetical protein